MQEETYQASHPADSLPELLASDHEKRVDVTVFMVKRQIRARFTEVPFDDAEVG